MVSLLTRVFWALTIPGLLRNSDLFCHGCQLMELFATIAARSIPTSCWLATPYNVFVWTNDAFKVMILHCRESFFPRLPQLGRLRSTYPRAIRSSLRAWPSGSDRLSCFSQHWIPHCQLHPVHWGLRHRGATQQPFQRVLGESPTCIGLAVWLHQPIPSRAQS